MTIYLIGCLIVFLFCLWMNWFDGRKWYDLIDTLDFIAVACSWFMVMCIIFAIAVVVLDEIKFNRRNK